PPLDGDLFGPGGEREDRRDADPHPSLHARGMARRVSRLRRAGQVGRGQSAVRVPGVGCPPAVAGGAAAATSAGPRAPAAGGGAPPPAGRPWPGARGPPPPPPPPPPLH